MSLTLFKLIKTVIKYKENVQKIANKDFVLVSFLKILASTGYFFYGGTFQACAVIASREDKSDRLVHLTTAKAAHSPMFRFSLERHGKTWLIASLERKDGTARWVPDTL